MDLERARAAATTVAPRGCDASHTAFGAPGGLRLRIPVAVGGEPLAAPPGASCSSAVVGGRHQRPSFRRIRAPDSGRRAAAGPQLSNLILPPFGNLRGGAGARTTRAPGRPRWGETRFGPRGAPGLWAPWGAHILTDINYTFSENISPARPRAGPEMIRSQSSRARNTVSRRGGAEDLGAEPDAVRPPPSSRERPSWAHSPGPQTGARAPARARAETLQRRIAAPPGRRGGAGRLGLTSPGVDSPRLSPGNRHATLSPSPSTASAGRGAKR